MPVKVVTDSTADLPPALAKELGITVVPLNVHFGTEVYRDGVEIFPDEFYRRLVSSPRLPTTSQPTVGDFLRSYQELSQDTDEILSVHISAKLSGTMNSAVQAREQFQGDSRIEIMDSLQGSLGLGMAAIAAGRAAQRGAGLDEVVEDTRRAIPQRPVFRPAGHTEVPGEGRANREGSGLRGVSTPDQAHSDHYGRSGPSPGAGAVQGQGHRASLPTGAGAHAG